MFRETRPTPILRIASLLACLAGLLVSAYSLTLLVGNYQLGQLNAPTTPSADVLPFGVNASLQDDDAATQLRKVQLMRDGGFAWVRQPFPWHKIEPSRGAFQWENWDRLVDLYNQHGLEVVAVLDQPPNWTRMDNGWSNRPPDDFDDFGSFVDAFVAHFRGRVHYIQIWDEPNIFPNWGNQPVDPAAYTALLRTAYERAKAADPRVKVLTAGPAPNVEKGGRNMSDLLFVSEMYRHGAGKYFDVLAVKPYGLWYPPDDGRVDDDLLNFSRVARHREISVRSGFADKPIWAVEFGWNSLPGDWKGAPSIWGSASEESQAHYTYETYKRASREWPWLQVLLVQGMLPQHYPQNPLYGFSIVDSHLEPRPVYRAIRDLAAAASAGAGEHSPNSPFTSYKGTWRDEGAAMVGGLGDSMEIRFTGTRLDLMLWKTPAGGVAQVSVDGRTADNSPQLSGDGTLDLYAKEVHGVRVVAASGLADGDHSVQVQLMRPTNDQSREPELRIGGFAVGRELNEPWLAGLGAAWVLWTLGLLGAFARLSAKMVEDLQRALVRVRVRIERLGDLPVAGGMVLVLALLYFTPGLALPALLLVALFALVCYRLEVGLLFVVLSAPFYMQPKAFGGASFSLVEILIVTCAFAYALKWIWTMRGLREERERGGIGSWRVNAPILLFLFASLFSLTASTMLHESLRELRTIVIEPVLFYFMLVSTLRGRGRALGLANALILAGFIVSVISLYQYAFTGDVITAEGVRRVKAFYGSPNNLGLFLGRAIPFPLCLAFLANRHRRLYLVALATMLAALILSFSVGAWTAVALSALLLAGLVGRKSLAWAAAGAVAGGFALIPVLQIERISSHLSLGNSTTGLRLWIWQAAVSMVRDNPIRGIGLDNFLYKYPAYMLPEAWREPSLSHPHNLILDFWLRLGIPGLVAVVWLLYGFFSASARLYRRLGDARSRALIIAMIVSMTDFVLHGLIDNSYFVVDLAIIFWATLAMLRVLEQEGELA